MKLLFEVLGTALSLWESKEKTKYIDRYMSLKRAYWEEYNKPQESRSDAALDNLEFEIKLLSTGFVAAAQEKKE